MVVDSFNEGKMNTLNPVYKALLLRLLQCGPSLLSLILNSSEFGL